MQHFLLCAVKLYAYVAPEVAGGWRTLLAHDQWEPQGPENLQGCADMGRRCRKRSRLARPTLVHLGINVGLGEPLESRVLPGRQPVTAAC